VDYGGEWKHKEVTLSEVIFLSLSHSLSFLSLGSSPGASLHHVVADGKMVNTPAASPFFHREDPGKAAPMG
jgi:hypothetical protein